jgi:hypothetical protein
MTSNQQIANRGMVANSVSNGSGPSLRVRVRIGTEPSQIGGPGRH